MNRLTDHDRDLLVARLTYVLLAVLTLGAAMLGMRESAPVHDALQALAAAHSLITGAGYASPIVYFEMQYLLGPAVPVPQTVFPPGWAMALAIALSMGVPDAWAPVLLASLARLASAELLRRVLREADCPPALSALVAAAWLVHPRLGELTRGGAVEPAFIACLLAAVLAVQKGLTGRQHGPVLLTAGLACAIAVGLRYAGVVPVAALALATALLSLGSGWKRALAGGALVGMPAAVLTTALLWRNHSLTGRFSGGQFDPAQSTDLGSAALALAEAARLAAGVPEGLGGGVALLIGAGLALTVSLAVGLQLHRRWGDGPHAPFAVAWVLCAALGGSQAAFFAWNTANVATWFASWRYLLPVVPLIWIILALAWTAVVGRAGADRGLRWMALLLICAGLFLTLRSLAEPTPMARARDTVEKGLAEPCGPMTVSDRLRRLPPDQPVLSTEEHLLHAVAGRPVLGTTSRLYTRRHWTSAEVQALMDRFGAEWVLVFPTTLARRANEFEGQPFHRALYAGEVPEGFEAVCSGALITVLHRRIAQ